MLRRTLGLAVLLALPGCFTPIPDPAAEETGASCPSGPARAFPSAEGFGTETPGGRGGRVIAVTNLDDSGVGSLRNALEVEIGPRIVVFRVAGTITLSAPILISGDGGGFVTVAGQTAPGDGVQLKGAGIDLRDGAHDVVLRHLKIRPGPEGASDRGLLIYGATARVERVVVDHCTLEWSKTHLISLSGQAGDITLQWTLMAEALTDANVSGAAGGGLSVSYAEGLTMSIHHSTWASNPSANPQLFAGDVLDLRNSVAYNWTCNNGVDLGRDCADPGEANVNANLVGNSYIPGPDSNCNEFAWMGGASTKVFVDDNRSRDCAQGCSDPWEFGFTEQIFPNCPLGSGESIEEVSADPAKFRASTAFAVPEITTGPAASVESDVFARVGADRPKRDSVDTRIIDEVAARGGKAGQGSDYPALGTAPAPADDDDDGIADAWERDHGLDPSDPNDANKVRASGYTNIERYLNELAGDGLCP